MVGRVRRKRRETHAIGKKGYCNVIIELEKSKPLIDPEKRGAALCIPTRSSAARSPQVAGRSFEHVDPCACARSGRVCCGGVESRNLHGGGGVPGSVLIYAG